MFQHTCSACHRRELIFPSQVTGVESTDHGIVVTFTCWCDAEQSTLTGVTAPPAAVGTTVEPAPAPAAA